MEWNKLASESLPSLATGGTSSIDEQRWNRNLDELHAASQTLLQQQHTPAANPATNAGNSLVGPSLIGMQPFYHPVVGNSAAGNSFPTASDDTDATATPGSLTLESTEDAATRLEQDILRRVIHEFAHETQLKVEQFVDKQFQRALEIERNDYLKDLIGSRTLGGASQEPLQHLQPQNKLITGSSLAGQDSLPLLLTSSAIKSGTDTGALDPAYVLAHIEIVARGINAASSNDPLPLKSFMEVVTAHPTKYPAADKGYRTGWLLLSNLLPVATQSSLPQAPVTLAMATLNHLCRQYQNFVTEQVRQVEKQEGQQVLVRRYGNQLADRCAAFVNVTVDCGIDGPKDSGIWPILYYCLRCGDAVAVQAVLQANGDASVDASVTRLVTTLANEQGTASSLWDACDTPPRLPASDRRMVIDLLESARHEDRPSVHKIGFLSLCSASARLPSSETMSGFSTVEDYLTGALWMAVLSSNPVEEIADIGSKIQQHGASYFGDAGSLGYSFALPLMATQQYEKALSHLSDAGGSMGLLQAAHMALVCASGGLPVNNLGEKDRSEAFVASLLVSYSNYLLRDPSAGPLAAIEYLVRIPDRSRAGKEVSALAVRTGQIEALFGKFDENGVRIGGAVLDKHFSAFEIKVILAEAASQFLRRNDRMSLCHAVMCYMLAERYTSVLGLMSRCLSPPDQPDVDRQFWLDQTEQFYTHFLTKKKRTHVLEILERDGNTGSINTILAMVDLNKFFSLASSERDEEALAVSERLGFLPRSTSELTAKELKFQGLDPSLKECLPTLLLRTVDVIHRMHARIKLDVQGTRFSVPQERLHELRETARVLVTFANLLGMPADQVDTLSRREALMV